MLPENYKEGAAHERMAGDVGEDIAEAGRGTDTVVAHLSLGEVVIPRAFLDDPQVMQMLQQIFEAGGEDMAKYTVGDPANSINPETGYPEFLKLKKIFKAAAPIAAAYFAPGIGAALGSTLSAPTLGAIGGGLGGAVSGGGVKGAALGALGGYGMQGGFSDLIGTLPGKELQGPSLSGAPISGVSQGSGALGTLGRTLGVNSGDLGGLVGGATGGGSSFGGGNLVSALGGFQQNSALNKIKKAQLGATDKQLANLENLNPVDVQNDPGYQFTQQQGEQALNRSLGAQGGLFSGRALKEASYFNTGLASKYYGDAYARQAGKVNAQNAIYGGQGDIQANVIGAKSNNINQTLANAFGTQVGDYGGGLTDAQLLQLLRQRVLAA